MTYNYKENERTAGIVRHSCGILFMLFAFAYLFFMQGDLIAKAQYAFSEGVTSYSTLLGAIIITALLRILQIPVDRFLKLPTRFHVITYIPSILILTILCDANEQVVQKFSLGWWWIGIPLALAATYLLAQLAKYLESYVLASASYNNTSPYLWPNFAILAALLLWCGNCHSAHDDYMFEQKVERLILDGDYEEALKVGQKSLAANRRLTNLRMFALDQLGVLPERLLDYPQYFAHDGLICIADTDTIANKFSARNVFDSFGCYPDAHVKTSSQYFQLLEERLMLTEDSLMSIELSKSTNKDSLQNEIDKRYIQLKQERRRIDNYILCSMLLDRDLDAFTEKIKQTYSDSQNPDTVIPLDSLPKVYREALIMVYPELGDTLMLKKYGEYVELKESEKDSTVSSNITRRQFGNTFWWYYFNNAITNKKP